MEAAKVIAAILHASAADDEIAADDIVRRAMGEYRMEIDAAADDDGSGPTELALDPDRIDALMYALAVVRGNLKDETVKGLPEGWKVKANHCRVLASIAGELGYSSQLLTETAADIERLAKQPMTLAQFRERMVRVRPHIVARPGSGLTYQIQNDDCAFVFVYPDGRCIEQMGNDTGYYLILEKSEFREPYLYELEEKLYEYAVRDGLGPATLPPSE